MTHFDGVHGWTGWQWLFLLEGLPAVLLGFSSWRYLTEGPGDAAWLPARERTGCERLEHERAVKEAHERYGVARALTSGRMWALGFLYFLLVTAM